jgi:hypothetical protein
LHRFDCLGRTTIRKTQKKSGAQRKSLGESEKLQLVVKLLHDTRAQEDRRCLQSWAEATQLEAPMASTRNESHCGNAPAPAQTQTPYTQLQTQVPFESQIPQDDEPQILGENSIEPALAADTRRTHARDEVAKSDAEMQNKLLTLLANSWAGTSNIASAQRNAQPAGGKQQSAAPETSDGNVKTASPAANREKRTKEPRSASPKPTEAVAIRDESETTEREPIAVQVQECAWMKGLPFTSEAFKVPRRQAESLQKESSWLKPQPGQLPFQDGNMPATLLTSFHQMADERAAEEDAADINSDMVDNSSPDPTPEEVDPLLQSLPQTTQSDEPPTSQVSWTPSPEPPQNPATLCQGLPPDSSYEDQAKNAENHAESRSLATQKKSRHAPVTDLLSDNESSSPPSSPPVVAVPDDSDQEMEMEESVPQALGEDIAKRKTQPRSNHLPANEPLRSTPVVQVRETPYGKGRIHQIGAVAATTDRASEQTQGSSGNAKDTSSTSIVYSTYNRPESSGSVDNGAITTHPTEDPATELVNGRAEAQEQEHQAHEDVAKQLQHIDIHDVSMPDEQPDPEEASKPMLREHVAATRSSTPAQVVSAAAPASVTKPSPKFAQPRSTSVESAVAPSIQPQTVSGSTKRKFSDSPTKDSRRHSKRREIKIFGFGDEALPTHDPLAAIRQEREESLQRFREDQKSKASFDGRPDSAGKLSVQQGVDTLDVEMPDSNTLGDMSPRHRSLYEEPSPAKPSSNAIPPTHNYTPTPAMGPEKKPSERQREKKNARAAELHARKSAQQVETESQSEQKVTPSKSRQQPQATPSEDRSSSDTRQRVSLPTDTDGERSLTVFESFKAAYPEYTGSMAHFKTLCKRMIELDEADKMVAKWQWDDYILRNRTDYKDYAMECAERGEDPEAYHRFYKNLDPNIDRVYTKNIIRRRETLQQALEEMNTGTPMAPPPTNTSRQHKSSRKSHPESSNQSSKHTQSRSSDKSSQPRHSLPTSSHTNHHQTLHRSKPRPHPPPTTPSRHENANTNTTGDPYRDYFFAIQRSTSFTGSTIVSSSPRNPQKR